MNKRNRTKVEYFGGGRKAAKGKKGLVWKRRRQPKQRKPDHQDKRGQGASWMEECQEKVQNLERREKKLGIWAVKKTNRDGGEGKEVYPRLNGCAAGWINFPKKPGGEKKRGNNLTHSTQCRS